MKTGSITFNLSDTRLIDTNTGGEKAGILDTEFTVVAADGGANPPVEEVKQSVLTLDLSVMTDSKHFDNALKELETALGKMASAAATLGAAKTRIDLQSDFMKALSDAIDRGVGALVDADMNEESARLSALQVQQQLGIQALAIANQNAQNILALFR